MGVSVREKQKNSDIWWIFVRHGGLRVSEKVDDKDIAEAAAVEIRREIRRGRFDIAAMQARRVATEKEERAELPTVARYYETVFEPVYVESAVAASTGAKYRKNFKLHVLPAVGSLTIDEVTHETMEEFIADLVKKGLARATIDSIVSGLRKFFNHARKRKLVSDNPASGLSELYSQAKTKHDAIEPLTQDEVPAFLSAVAEYASQHYALFFAAIHTGLRAGELAGLQHGDVDFRGNYLIAQRSIDRVHRKVVPTKSKRIRRVDLSDELTAVLQKHIRGQKTFWLRRGRQMPEWVFPNEDGGWSDMSNLANRHFHRCLEKAGLHRRRFHDLRHSFASLLLTNGAPIAYVSEQMGHANIQLTVKLYGHLQPGANRRWMNSLPGMTQASDAASAAL